MKCHIYVGNICERIGIIKLHTATQKLLRTAVLCGRLYLCNRGLKSSCPPFLAFKTIFPFLSTFVDKIYDFKIFLYCCHHRSVNAHVFSPIFPALFCLLFGPLVGIQPHNTTQQACATWHVSCRP